MAIKDDISELKRLMKLRDDTEYRLTCIQSKILNQLGGHIRAREYLDEFGIELGWEGFVLVARSKNFMEFVRADREQA